MISLHFFVQFDGKKTETLLTSAEKKNSLHDSGILIKKTKINLVKKTLSDTLMMHFGLIPWETYGNINFITISHCIINILN